MKEEVGYWNGIVTSWGEISIWKVSENKNVRWKIVNQGDDLFEQEEQHASQANENVLRHLSLVNANVKRGNGNEESGACLRIWMENESPDAYVYVQGGMET